MKKNIVQDVVPPKKSIRNIRLSEKKEVLKHDKKVVERQYPEYTQAEDFSRPVPIQSPMRIEPKKVENSTYSTYTAPETVSSTYRYEYNDEKKKSNKWIYITSAILILAVSFGVSSLFKSAVIKISPKQDSKSINEIFSAKKDAPTGLSFQTVTVSKDIEKTIPSTGEEKVERKSQGKIIIYNNFNNQPQKLMATTRFQTPEGLIFRLINPAIVPGKQVIDGKPVAGSVEVTVEADKPGVSYNIPLKDFTIPGFKGDPKYTAVYARSKTEMTGGFSGLQKVASKEAMAEAEKDLKNSIEISLLKDLEAQIPANFISYKDGLSYELEPVTQMSDASNAEVVLRKKGKVTAIIFDRAALTKAILSKAMPDIESEMVKIPNMSSLEFKIDKENFDLNKQLSFSLIGNVNFVWVIDENKLKSDLLGLSRKSAKLAIGQYPSISEAWIETRPFWNQTIPNNTDKVVLVNTSEQ